MERKDFEVYCFIDDNCWSILKNVMDRLGFFVCVYDCILKVVCIIVDLDYLDMIGLVYLFEVI